MRTLLTALTVLLLAACGSPTGPGDEVPDGPLQMALVQGDEQEVQVTDTLPTDVLAEITKGGTPLTDQLVDWVVLTDNCGAPFVSTTRTDSLGRTGNRIVAGTRAWTRPDGPDVCELEIRYALRDGSTVIAEVDTTVGYLVEPGVASELRYPTLAVTDQDIMTLQSDLIVDQYGNPALWRARPTCCLHAQSDSAGAASSRTVVWDSAGTGELHLVAGDSVVDRAVLETGAGGNISIDFGAHGG